MPSGFEKLRHPSRLPDADRQLVAVYGSSDRASQAEDLATGDVASDQGGHLADELDRDLMLAGREAALLASHVIDDPVLPINCINQQGRLALSVTAHSTALRCPSAGFNLAVWLAMGRSQQIVSARGCSRLRRRRCGLPHYVMLAVELMFRNEWGVMASCALPLDVGLHIGRR